MAERNIKSDWDLMQFWEMSEMCLFYFVLILLLRCWLIGTVCFFEPMEADFGATVRMCRAPQTSIENRFYINIMCCLVSSER